MEYTIRKEDKVTICLEKHTGGKGVFQNIGTSKVGEITFFDDTGVFEFLQEGKITYMEIGIIKFPLIFSYRGEAETQIIGSLDDHIDIHKNERIKFIYEALKSNPNYNFLTCVYKYEDGYIDANFEIDVLDEDSGEFEIMDL